MGHNHSHGHSHGDDETKPRLIVGTRLEFPLVLVGGALVAAAWISTLVEAPEWVMWAAALASAPLTSPRTFRRAVAALASFEVGIDVLMFVAAIGAASIGEPVEGAFLLFLFGVGAVGEYLAMRRAENSLSSLEALAPEDAERIDEGGGVEVVPLKDIAPGDLIRVRPFGRIPCDGIIEEGTTAIDESTLTGESIPIEKGPGDEVLAGTLNTASAITIRILRPAADSALARVIRVVTEARTRRAPVEMLTERLEKIYAPGVLIAAAFVFLIPSLAWGHWGEWFYRSMAFLTGASPCALAIGAPATYLCGIAAGARRGIVFKGGESIEALAKARTIAFDKTGTITTGKPKVHNVVAIEGTEAELLAIAAAIETQASHPLADAIVADARARGLDLDAVTEVEQIAGLGVRGLLADEAVLIASPAIIKDQPGAARAGEVVHELSASGDSVIVVEVADRIIGLIGVRDSVRPDAAAAIAELKDRGFRLVMLTGDHEEAAAVIAEEVGISEVFAGQKPEDKLKVIEQLIDETGHVAMIGDGVNDAPALARASVSLSMGGAASDVAAENADIAIMGERLDSVVEAIDISRFGARNMRENLAIALGVIVIVAPLAVVGVADLAMAVIFHEGSTVVVVGNALRQLRRARKKARA
jgi:Zn2+/Cd2+-exporting ATPase